MDFELIQISQTGRKKNYLNLVFWILVHPVPQDGPVEGLRVAFVAPNVFHSLNVDVHVAFCYGRHVVGGNNAS